MSETAQMTPQERKEAYLNELEARIVKKFEDGRLITTFETSSCARWSREEYFYMPTVAARLREKGYTVSSSVNHGITDWIIGL